MTDVEITPSVHSAKERDPLENRNNTNDKTAASKRMPFTLASPKRSLPRLSPKFTKKEKTPNGKNLSLTLETGSADTLDGEVSRDSLVNGTKQKKNKNSATLKFPSMSTGLKASVIVNRIASSPLFNRKYTWTPEQIAEAVPMEPLATCSTPCLEEPKEPSKPCDGDPPLPKEDPKHTINLRPPSMIRDDKKGESSQDTSPLIQEATPCIKHADLESNTVGGEGGEESNAPLLVENPRASELADDQAGEDKASKTAHTVAFQLDEDPFSDDSGSIIIPPPPPGCCAWRGFDIAAVVAMVLVLSFGAAALALHLDGQLKTFLGMEDDAQIVSPPCHLDDKSTVCSPNAVCVPSNEDYHAGSTCRCMPGYTGNGFTCNDIDECVLSAPNCSSHSYCSNTMGSYTCRCHVGFIKLNGECVDLNECQKHFYCPATSRCVNTLGSYKCRCLEGYHSAGSSCIDIDECKTSAHNCHANATCVNKMGSYECVCKEGYFGNGTHCEVDACFTRPSRLCDKDAVCRLENNAIKCMCKAGYTGDGITCEDVNECQLPGSCHVHATCANTNGSHVCTCNKGFIGEGDLCTDIDECHQKAHLCNKNALCHNIPGSYKCMCLKGYHGDDCHDANECERGEHTCSKNAMCINTSGSYECVCNDGYRGNGTICEIPSPGKRHNAGDHHRLDGYLFVHIVIFYLFIGCW